MTPPKDFNKMGIFSELLQLLGELADDQLSGAGGARLVELLRNDAAARCYYLDYMQIHAQLVWKHELCDAEAVCSEGDCPNFRVSENGTVPFIAAAVKAQGRRGADDDRPSTVNLTRCSFQDESLSAGRFSVGGSPLSYVIAVMILGIGLVAASACEVPRFQAVANNSARAAPASSVSEPGLEGKTDSKPVWGNGQTRYASITELRVYNMDVKHQLKIAASDREVARTE